MYSNAPAAAMGAPQQSRSMAPETFLLDQDAQQSLPPDAVVALQQVDNLKYFLISAPVDWQPDQYIRRFLLPTGEYVSCVLWNNLFHISGTDIVRCLSFRFQAFGRPVKNSKKFEEGIFSDLRNLKSGTDASLEEPKSAFLDFLYKNNCIRTQKKQKVFYWYSVPHDRLFLDALERDLKREKMGQEATTVAVSEPALSFEFDSSQSLFEQLTKAQQTNSSSFNNNNNVQSYSQSTSPVLRGMDQMPPPMVPQQIPATIPEEPLHQMSGYAQPGLTQTMPGMPPKRDNIQYDRNGIPLSQVHQRHSSMPAYMEYSPAPSFVSSQYDDYGGRGMSFEPITPPQHNMNLGAEPAYIANEDTGLYSAIPDMGVSQSFNPLMNMPPSHLAGPQLSGVSRGFPPANVYNVIEGSPTYKQRRRRSSLSAGVGALAAASGAHSHQAHAPHRSSDLRRSMSQSVQPVAEADESAHESPKSSHQAPKPDAFPDMSRHGTPLHTVEDESVPPSNLLGQDDFKGLHNGNDFSGDGPQHAAVSRAAAQGSQGPGAFRRARSATMMELGPYPQKSHSCPIPTCGRLFKRLEHLKRHVRTHTQERPYICPYCQKAFSRSDNLAQHRRTHEPRQDGAEPVPDLSEEDMPSGGEGDAHAGDEAGDVTSPEDPQATVTAAANEFLAPGALSTPGLNIPGPIPELASPGLGGSMSQMVSAQHF